MSDPYNPMYMGDQSPQGIPNNYPQYDALRANFMADVQRKLAMRSLEWLFAIPAQLVIPASGGHSIGIDIKSDAHFECFFITGDFTTQIAGNDPPDDGANHCGIRISDGSNDLKLMENFAPANLFLSPGRVLAPGVTGNPSNQLFYPFPFYHIFPASGSIILEGQNSATAENTVNLLFWGKKLRASIGNAQST